jgi:hypothetical protein
MPVITVITPNNDFNAQWVNVRVMMMRFLGLPVQVAFENDATASLFLPFAEMFHPKTDLPVRCSLIGRPEVRQLTDKSVGGLPDVLPKMPAGALGGLWWLKPRRGKPLVNLSGGL